MDDLENIINKDFKTLLEQKIPLFLVFVKGKSM